jgi:hypothetical protein
MATGFAPIGERRERLSRPGPMTLAMRAARPVDGARVLRVARLEQGRVVEERVLTRRADVTIGSAHVNTFLATGDAPESARLFEVQGDGWVLHTRHASAGRVVLASGPHDVRSSERIRLDDDARGKVQVGDTTFLFQLVPPPPVSAKPQLPLGVRGGLTSTIDWSFTVIAACSFLLHFTFAGAVNGDWFDAAIDEERETAQLVEQAKSRPAVEIEQPKPEMVDPSANKAVDPKVASNNASNGKTKSTSGSNGTAGKTNGSSSPLDSSKLSSDLDDIGVKVVGSFGDKGPALASVLKPGQTVSDDQLDEIAKKKNGVDTEGKLTIGGPGGDPIFGNGKPGFYFPVEKSAPVVVKAPTTEPKAPSIDVMPGPAAGAGVPKDVDSVIARNRWRFRACFSKEIAGGATNGGTINVMVKVGEGGSVISSSAASTTASSALTQCVVGAFSTMKFAEPDGGSSQFKVPVVLSTK